MNYYHYNFCYINKENILYILLYILLLSIAGVYSEPGVSGVFVQFTLLLLLCVWQLHPTLHVPDEEGKVS